MINPQQNWIPFTDEEYDKVWNRFYDEFQFKPSVLKNDWPSFIPPSPYITYDISKMWEALNKTMDVLRSVWPKQRILTENHAQFVIKALLVEQEMQHTTLVLPKALREESELRDRLIRRLSKEKDKCQDTYYELNEDLTKKSLIALQTCTIPEEYLYSLDWEHNCYHFNPFLQISWVNRFFPEGDYYLFLEKNFKWGYLGHPWEQSVCIFGVELIEQFQKSLPNAFGEIIRQG
ncbi:DUF2716 domain-containing protein [Desmospora profundinema]|uniref:DUF2716 domain-containing protein n=1 Tax=Desmospora profundinema TaxID=1571184 RepID=A0ABU1IR88_9BACL|nr:DUF2716 domain-containing protein [Desmospora profundinema]MDR6227312.1 hypothetical protein [Desmospora profundinema]